MHNGIIAPFLEMKDKELFGWVFCFLYCTIQNILHNKYENRRRHTMWLGVFRFSIVQYNTFLAEYILPSMEAKIRIHNWLLELDYNSLYELHVCICGISVTWQCLWILYYAMIILVYPFWYVHIIFSKGEPNVMPNHVADLVSILFKLQKMYL